MLVELYGTEVNLTFYNYISVSSHILSRVAMSIYCLSWYSLVSFSQKIPKLGDNNKLLSEYYRRVIFLSLLKYTPKISVMVYQFSLRFQNHYQKLHFEQY